MRSIWILAPILLLAACTPREEILTGERVGLREVLQDPLNRGAASDTKPTPPRPLTLPAPQVNADWTHRNGSPSHRITQPALARTLSQIWSVDIGRGDARQRRITADPVVAGGRVFTLDAHTLVTAVSTDGTVLWTRDLSQTLGLSANVSGGGLAFGDGRLFVTTALRTLSALDPATGTVIWTQEFDAPVTAPPTVLDGSVYVVASDASAWAIDTQNGRVRWQLPGTPTDSSLVGGASPAVTDRLAIFPFASGEVAAALRRAGVRIWGTSVAGKRRGRAWSNVSGITGDPVIAGDTVFVGSQSGRVVALRLADGERIWTATEAAYNPVWPVDTAVFLISDEGRLVRLDARTGAVVWAQQLPNFIPAGFSLNPFRKKDRRGPVYGHFGPVLAGGRLIVASADGKLRSFDPDSGALISELALPAGAAANPVVAGQVLYIVTANGKLAAFR